MRSASDREARQQVLTRSFNEWIEGANESMGPHPGTDPFRCECGDGECSNAIELTRSEYAHLRSSATRFAIAPNHENPESDRVVSEDERYSVVEKLVGRASNHAWNGYSR